MIDQSNCTHDVIRLAPELGICEHVIACVFCGKTAKISSESVKYFPDSLILKRDELSKHG